MKKKTYKIVETHEGVFAIKKRFGFKLAYLGFYKTQTRHTCYDMVEDITYRSLDEALEEIIKQNTIDVAYHVFKKNRIIKYV